MKVAIGVLTAVLGSCSCGPVPPPEAPQPNVIVLPRTQLDGDRFCVERRYGGYTCTSVRAVRQFVEGLRQVDGTGIADDGAGQAVRADAGDGSARD